MVFLIFCAYVGGLLLIYKPLIGIIVLLYPTYISLKKREKKYLYLLIFILIGILFSYLSHLYIDVNEAKGLALIVESKKDYVIVMQGFNKYYIYLKDNYTLLL